MHLAQETPLGAGKRTAMQIDLHSGYVTTISNTFHFFYHEDDGEHPFRQERPRARSVDSWERSGVKRAPSPEVLTRELEAWWTRGSPVRRSRHLAWHDLWLSEGLSHDYLPIAESWIDRTQMSE